MRVTGFGTLVSEGLKSLLGSYASKKTLKSRGPGSGNPHIFVESRLEVEETEEKCRAAAISRPNLLLSIGVRDPLSFHHSEVFARSIRLGAAGCSSRCRG